VLPSVRSWVRSEDNTHMVGIGWSRRENERRGDEGGARHSGQTKADVGRTMHFQFRYLQLTRYST
jgi:hypothetical protein